LVKVDVIPAPLNVSGRAVCSSDLPVDCFFFPALPDDADVLGRCVERFALPVKEQKNVIFKDGN
jgi:hypothetical protein